MREVKPYTDEELAGKLRWAKQCAALGSDTGLGLGPALERARWLATVDALRARAERAEDTIVGLNDTITREITRAEKAEAESASIKEIHARILSWAPQDVHGAYAVLMQMAASVARAGGDGKAVGAAVGTIKRHVSQAEAGEDEARAEVAAERERARGLGELLRESRPIIGGGSPWDNLGERIDAALDLGAKPDAVADARDRIVRYAVEAGLHQSFPVGSDGLVDQSSPKYQSYIATLADLWRSVDDFVTAEDAEREGGSDDRI